MIYILQRFSVISILLLSPIVSVFASEKGFSWNGFGTIGVTQTDNESAALEASIPYSTHEEDLSEESDTKLGLQGTYKFSDRWSATLQLMSRAKEDYKVEPEWAYLSFQVSPNLKARGGRLRRALFKYSDFFDVGYAYHWVRPPTINYFEFGPFYNAIESVDLYYQKTFGDWNLTSQSYIGRDSGDGELFNEQLTYEESRASGIALQLENENLEFRAGYHYSKFSIDIPTIKTASDALTQFGFGNLASQIAIDNKTTNFISLGATVREGDWTLGTEITRADPKKSLLPTIDIWYASLARALGPWTFHYSYGQQKAKNSLDVVSPIFEAANLSGQSPDPNAQIAAAALQMIGTELDQVVQANESNRESHIIGLRYDFLDSYALKLEAERLRNRDTETKANIFSISLDFTF